MSELALSPPPIERAIRPASELPERVRRGEIDHALVIAALHRWALSQEKR